MFETLVVRANECYSQRQIRRHNRAIFSIFFNMKVCCVFSLESPHDEAILMRTQNIPFSIKKKENAPKLSQICSHQIFPRDSRTNSKQPS